MVTQESPRLGACPMCREDVHARHVLISYETDSGAREFWAECPGCRDVVHPQ